MAKSINLVISDIDGTILTSNHQLPQKVAQSIMQLEQKKIPFVLASARSPKGMLEITQALRLTSPIVSYNGAYVVTRQQDTYQEIISHPLNPQEAKMILQWTKNRFPEISINLYAGTEWYVFHKDIWVREEMRITQIVPQLCSLEALLDENIAIHKILFIGKKADIACLMSELSDHPLAHSAFYLSKENYLEFTHKAVSKEQAVKELARYYQLPLTEVMTIGDNFNDLPMLKAAGLGIAMGNAPAEVKEFADAVTLDNDHFGAAVAIDKYILAKQ